MDAHTTSYEIATVQADDLDELVSVFDQAMGADNFWQFQVRDATRQDQLTWLKEWFIGPMLKMKSYVIFKAVEKSPNEHIVGWTAMRLNQAVDALERDYKSDMEMNSAHLPAGWNADLFRMIDNAYGLATKAGYCPDKHMMRRGLYVLPAYWGHGIGSKLSRHLEAIANTRSTVTYVRARPNAAAMFQKEGFSKVDEVSIDYHSFGLDQEPDTLSILSKVSVSM